MSDTKGVRPTNPPSTFEQLRLALIGEIAPPDKKRSDKGVWRDLLKLARAAGSVHHVAWILFGRSDERGRVRNYSESILAQDGGISRSTVTRGIRELKRLGAVRQRRPQPRQRGGHFGLCDYELNLGGGFTVRHRDARPCVRETQHVGFTYGGLPFSTDDVARPKVFPRAREGSAEQQQRRTDGLIAVIAVRTRELGRPAVDEAALRRQPLDVLQRQADALAAEQRQAEQEAEQHRTAPRPTAARPVQEPREPNMNDPLERRVRIQLLERAIEDNRGRNPDVAKWRRELVTLRAINAGGAPPLCLGLEELPDPDAGDLAVFEAAARSLGEEADIPRARELWRRMTADEQLSFIAPIRLARQRVAAALVAQAS